jgi:hypothetical protein
LRTLSVTQQTKVLEYSKGVMRSGTELWCHPIRKSDQFKLIGEQHVAMAGIAERETACKTMRHWRELRAMVMT